MFVIKVTHARCLLLTTAVNRHAEHPSGREASGKQHSSPNMQGNPGEGSWKTLLKCLLVLIFFESLGGRKKTPYSEQRRHSSTRRPEFKSLTSSICSAEMSAGKIIASSFRGAIRQLTLRSYFPVEGENVKREFLSPPGINITTKKAGNSEKNQSSCSLWFASNGSLEWQMCL